MKKTLFITLALGLCFSALAQTSEDNPRLKKALARFPAADTNKDGVLTMQEAQAFMAARAGGGGQAQGQGQEQNAYLKKVLERFPEADTNKDGVLSMQEAMALRSKMTGARGQGKGRGGKKGRKRSIEADANRDGTLTPQEAAAFLVTQSAGKTAAAKGGEAIRGYTGLFMGHSFFQPSALALRQIIKETTVKGHGHGVVFAGGAGGSARGLWASEQTRKEGQAFLDTGKVELLAMTYCSEADSSVQHYSKWFDYAISKNPKTTFMVAVPWGTQLYKADKARLEQRKANYTKLYEILIVKLREKYPGNKILYCPYGFGTYELIDRLNSGNLPGVKHILNPDKAARGASKRKKDQLLNDGLGHAGELVVHLATLLWLQTLYDYDLSKLPPQEVDGLPKIDVVDIATEVHKKIEPFNAVYKGK